MTNKLSFSVEDIRLDENLDKSQFSVLSVDAFATGVSAHGTYVTEDTLRKTAPSILQKPFVFAVDKILDDLGTHSPSEMPGGFVPHDSPIEFKTLPDGRVMMTVKVLVWSRYSGKLLEYFKRDNNRKSVSVEIEVYDSKEDEKNGLIELLNYSYSAITALGDFVRAAIPNAQAVLQFSKEYEEDKAEYEFSSRYDSLDFKIPDSVKKNAQKAVENYRANGGKATSVSLAMGRFLAKNDKIHPEKIRQIYKYFKGKEDMSDEMTSGLYGGKEAALWAKDIVEKMDKLDSEHVTYFEKSSGTGGEENMADVLTFPYKDMKDVNPALKGIDPPISLAQANAIAKAADAIGSDKSKNGWAIAIAQFKKNHKVENGHWVAKEKMAEYDEEGNEVFAKEDLGKGDALKVDKSKDAMSSSPWGNVDKTALRNKVLNASNYSSLVKDVYMLVEDGWEDHPSSSLKYPVMQLSGDTLVYNRYGLSAALQRAKGQNESSVVSKVETIYGKLGLDKPEKESMSDEDNCIGMEEVIMTDKNKDEEKEVKPKEEEMAKPKSAAEKEKEETPAEEKQETPEEEKKEEEQNKEDKGKKEEKESVEMSLNENFDVSPLLEFLKNENATYREMKGENFSGITHAISLCMGEIAKGMDAQPKVILEGMLAFMKFSSKELVSTVDKNKVFAKENEDLKLFKLNVETERKTFEVDTVLKEAFDAGMPEEEIENCKADAANFSLDNIDAYKNMVKAKAFKYFGTRKESDGGIKRIGLPFTAPKYNEPSLWK